MTFGMEQIEKVVEAIKNEQLLHTDTTVIGDNSSGKSLLLRQFIELISEERLVYFIDAVNRGFDVKKIPKEPYLVTYRPELLKTRLREDYFNLKDSFNCFGTWTERIEGIYEAYEERLQELFEKMTGESFQIDSQSVLGEVKFKEGNALLSTGYQAMVRLILELLYYETEVKAKEVEKAWVVIDEIDEFLSPRYAARIVPFLRKEFPWAKWLMATHSSDLVAAISDANLVLLDNNMCEVLDSNDYASLPEVQIIFERLFGNVPKQNDQVDKLLRCLLNNKMNHLWGTKDEKVLEDLQKKQLSASQRLIVRQIQNW